MSTDPTPLPERLDEAMKQLVEASNRVTALLRKMATGETVDPDDLEDARKKELLASTRYAGTFAGNLIERVAAPAASENETVDLDDLLHPDDKPHHGS